MSDFKKWTSIDRFSDVYKFAKKNGVESMMTRAKIKLHGTNAAIRVDADGNLTAQKRSSDITPQNDNAGFAAWVETLKGQRMDLRNMIIFGEWAGPGIQSGDAVANIPQKSFFIFSIYDIETGEYWFNPLKIASFLVWTDLLRLENVHIVPWLTDVLEVNFLDQDQCQAYIDALTELVDEIGKEDPYISELFGIKGPGEGVVVYPLTAGEHFTSYLFKVKTEAHTVNKTKNRNAVAPKKPDGMNDFLETFFTENRFRQMLDEIGGEADRKNTGAFLKAVMTDVHKESKNEIELADFEWKDVPKYGADVTKAWFFKECDKV